MPKDYSYSPSSEGVFVFYANPMSFAFYLRQSTTEKMQYKYYIPQQKIKEKHNKLHRLALTTKNEAVVY